MAHEMRQERLMLIGLIPIVVLVASFGTEFLLGVNGSLYNQPVIALLLQFVFVFCVGIVVAIISARAYILSGSTNILFLGLASLIFGTMLVISQWALTPSFGLSLTTNQAITIGNMGVLLASVSVLFSAVLTSLPLEGHWPNPSHKGLVLTSYCIVLTVILVVIVEISNGVFPTFFISGVGSTLIREVVLASSMLFLVVTGAVYGWRYIKSRSPILYWYTLAIVLFMFGIVGSYYTVKIGDAINWGARISFYLMGAYLLLAVRSRNHTADNSVNITERWAEAFRNDPEQIATFFSTVSEGVVYCQVITDKVGRPIDLVYLDVNEAYLRINKMSKEKVVGKRATEVYPGIRNDPADPIGINGRVALTREPISYEVYSQVANKWFHSSVFSPRKGYFVGIFEDITERKKAEEEVTRLASFPMLNPNLIAEFDLDGNLQYVNPAMESLFPDS